MLINVYDFNISEGRYSDLGMWWKTNFKKKIFFKQKTILNKSYFNTVCMTAAMKLKDACSLEEKLWPT